MKKPFKVTTKTTTVTKEVSTVFAKDGDEAGKLASLSPQENISRQIISVEEADFGQPCSIDSIINAQDLIIDWSRLNKSLKDQMEKYFPGEISLIGFDFKTVMNAVVSTSLSDKEIMRVVWASYLAKGWPFCMSDSFIGIVGRSSF